MKIENHLNTTVHRAKLILLDKLNLEVYATQGDLAKSDRTGELYIHGGGVLSSKKMYPFIISETEEIEEEDWFYHKHTGKIAKASKVSESNIFTSLEDDKSNYIKYGCVKVLALPEHFSDKHLQAIADGKMKEGEVLIKCEYNIGNFSHYSQDLVKVAVYKNDVYIVYLNQQNHITLFPAKQPVEQAAEEYQDKLFRSTEWLQYSKQLIEKSFKAGAEWAKNNNHK